MQRYLVRRSAHYIRQYIFKRNWREAVEERGQTLGISLLYQIFCHFSDKRLLCCLRHNNEQQGETNPICSRKYAVLCHYALKRFKGVCSSYSRGFKRTKVFSSLCDTEPVVQITPSFKEQLESFLFTFQLHQQVPFQPVAMSETDPLRGYQDGVPETYQHYNRMKKNAISTRNCRITICGLVM